MSYTLKVKLMKNHLLSVIGIAAIALLSSCGKIGKSKSKGLPNDGQLHGVAPSTRYTPPKPPGMIYVPPGTFHMGPSDEDVNYAFTARNKAVSISGFWMDATEITNNEYRQFTKWVTDSIAAKLLGAPYVKQDANGVEAIDWKKAETIKYNDRTVIEKIDAMILTPDNRLYGVKAIDPNKVIYHSEVVDFKEAARRENAHKPISQFIVKTDVPVDRKSVV